MSGDEMSEAEREAAAKRGADALVDAAARKPEELTTGARALLQPRGETVLGVSEPAPSPAPAAPPAPADSAPPAPRGLERIGAQRALAGEAVQKAAALASEAGTLNPAQVGLALDAASALLGRDAVRAFVSGWLASSAAEGAAPTA